MKSFFLAFLFMVSIACGEQGMSLGQLLDINGTISSVNVDKGIVTIGSTEYTVETMSSITVNGKSGSIRDLASGMKVTGSAEVTGMSPYRSPTKTLRMLHATGDAAAAQSTPGAVNPQANVPQGVPGAPAGNPNPMAENPAAADFKQKLGGTFWMLTLTNPAMLGNVQEKPNPDLWFSLNADGTVTCGWLPTGGTWQINNQLLVVVKLTDAAQEGPGRIPNPGMMPGAGMFPGAPAIVMAVDHDLTAGRILGAQMMITVGRRQLPVVFFSAGRVNPPTRDMLAKVPAPVAPVAAASATPTPAPASPETQNTASEIVRANSNNLVFVTGKEGAGSGFIANFGGGSYLFTNAHVAAGINDANFKTLGGTVVKGDAASVAVGHDIFCYALAAGGTKPLEIMQSVDENARIGDDVVVLGNAEGSGVVNTIMGKIVGIGPNLVEIDAQFVPGNSGSPIIHLKSGKVIGVATYTVTRKYDATTHEKMATPEVRRYGYRIDSVKNWQPVNWRTFYAEADAMEKVHTLTRDLDAFFTDISETHGKVTVERHTNPVIKSRIAQWQEDKGGERSMSDRSNADASFLSFLKIACQSDISALQNRLTYDYFQRELVTEQETRTEMSKAFSEIISDIRQ